MILNDGAVQRDGFDLDMDNLRLLEPLEYAVHYAVLAPTIHSRVNSMRIPEMFGKVTQLAALFGHVQDVIQHIQIIQPDVATLPEQTIGDLLVLRLRNFHAPLITSLSLPRFHPFTNLCEHALERLRLSNTHLL